MDQRAEATAAPTDAPAERAARAVFLVGEAIALVYYVVISRPMWFYLDEWDFLAHRTAGDVTRLFKPHFGHWSTLPILQGVEMGRPSLIGLEVQMADGKLAGVRISGKAVKVTEGTLYA